MNIFALALTSGLIAFVASTSISRADTAYSSTLSGTVNGTVMVPGGASSMLSHVTVTGGVRVLQNASLIVDATQQPATILPIAKASSVRGSAFSRRPRSEITAALTARRRSRPD